ncbi:hypothetical protein [Caulobacter sp. CCG-8]|uniref:hypothetical protein n=1 Tax=Caulobacter sp. CCG-8 TaxID=3127958 RepID=UPI00307F9AA4
MLKHAIIGAAIALVGFATADAQDHYVRGYTRSNGTYVAPHYQTNPNSTTSDNYSTRGNTNPYTGRPGTKPDTRPAYGYGSTDSSNTNTNSNSGYGYGSSYGSSTSSTSSTTSGRSSSSCTSIYGC